MKVVITGANRGLGLELVKAFSDRGHQVIAAYRNKDDIKIFDNMANTKPILLDVANQESVDKFASDLESETVDILINNAGVLDSDSIDGDTYEDMEDLAQVFKVNSIAPRLISDKLKSSLARSSKPLVATVSSHMGAFSRLNEFNAGHWAYSSSKAAVNFAMTSFALTNPNIKTLIFHPGWMKTDMGGSSAKLDPKESAEKIYNLLMNDEGLESGKLYDIEGDLIPF